MKVKRLSAVLLSAAFALVVAAGPFCALPPKPKACCGPSCPEPKPKAPPTCCELTPAQTEAIVMAAPAPLPLLAADLGAGPVLADQHVFHLVSARSDRSPPQRRRLAPSGLSPPRLA